LRFPISFVAIFRTLACLGLFLALYLQAFAASATAGQANIFIYHRFGEARYPSTNIALDVFSAQLRELREGDYSVLPLGEVVDRLRSGDPLPERCACLTVDDAFRSFLSGAMPLLRRHGFPVTLFVNTDAVGTPGYLDWDELRALAREGVEIGNHSASHAYLVENLPGEDDKAWRERVGGDLIRAQRQLERELGGTSRLFAYPYGEYSPGLLEVVRDLGFSGAAAQQSGVAAHGADFFTLPRFPMGGAYATLEGFRDKLAMRHLAVKVVSPVSPIIGAEDPPVLIVEIPVGEVDLSRLRCFVQGQGEARISRDPAAPGRFRVQALQPLSGRRNKYTLTAPSLDGRRWYWFSQLWVRRGTVER